MDAEVPDDVPVDLSGEVQDGWIDVVEETNSPLRHAVGHVA
jgi:hypothetical protein